QVQHYSYAFAQWVASADNIQPLLALIDHDTATVLPEADKIIAAAQDNAAGDTSAQIPATDRRHEIGAMARSVIVFRDNMIERDRLSGMAAETNAAREQRGESIGAMIAQFRTSVEQALARLREQAERLERASSGLNAAADSVTAEAQQAETRVGAASVNVTTVASSIEELAASIG